MNTEKRLKVAKHRSAAESPAPQIAGAGILTGPITDYDWEIG
jgi:hypothetical protein